MDWKVVGIDINAQGSTINEVSSTVKTNLTWYLKNYKAYNCRIDDLNADKDTQTW